MPKKILYLLVLVCGISFSQTVSVNDTSHTATDLANLLLDGSCIDPTNISSSSSQSAAYFNNNGGAFPLTEGIILRSGIAAHTAGMYTGNDLSSSINTNSDPDLDAIADAISGQNATITDTAFLQFDFTPISSNFNFNFIFASNEYGQWQCGFSDVFAFLITDLTTGITTNLAVIPGTTTPIAVTTVRDNTHNNGCTSENPNLFDTYNVTNPATSTINMRGYTTTLSATSTLTPNNPYRIKLAIGDFNLQDFDSAVFIDAGSFNTEIDLGPDTNLCLGDSFDVTTGLDETEYTHNWTLNGNPIGTNSNTLTIDQIGTYDVIATQNGTNCQIPGQIVISDLTYNTPDNLTNCDTGAAQYSYDLTQNDITTLGLDPTIYQIEYYDSVNSFPGNPIPNNDLTNYINDGNPQPITIKILNTITGNYCDVDIIFMLELSASPIANPQPNNIDLCENGGTTTVDLTLHNAQVLGGLPPTSHNVIYFSSQVDAQNNQNSIGTSIDVSSANSPITIWVRVENINNPDCFDITSFQIIIHPLPNVPELPDVTECSQYTLPPLNNGTYYDASGGPAGGGNQLNPGDIVNTGGTYYVFVGPDTNGCTNESDFIVTLVDEYGMPVNYCQSDMFTIPQPIQGADSNFYTETGGPNGTGVLLPAGTPVILNSNGDLEYQGLGITVTGNSDTIYFYAEVNGVFCIEIPFPISIFIDPPVDQPTDVTTCIDYTLPALTNGNYVGHNVGDLITSTETISISNTIDNATTDAVGNPIIHSCTSTSSFLVTIINDPPNITDCGSYTLPNLTVGEYYLQANGQGTVIPQGTVINLDNNGDLVYEGTGITVTGNTDNIYVFATDTVNATNCTNNMFFTLTINPIPPVDSSSNSQIVECVTDGYILPNLTHGDYYSEPGGQGTLIPDLTNISIDPNGDLDYGNGLGVVHPGIGNVNTIYIYNEVNGCSNESSFTVEIRDLPAVDSFADVYQCTPYTLAATTDGDYYTEPGGPNGTGTIVTAGTQISSITTLYIYNEWNDLAGCSNETTFTVNILGVDVGTIANVNECDSYSLPSLTVGNYYSQQQTYPPNAADEIPVGTTYTENQPAPNPIYVYAFNEDRIVCESQTSFTVTVSDTPNLPNFNNEVVCEGYTLPTLDNSTYNVGYYLSPGGVDPVSNNILAAGNHTIYVYATAFNNTNCFDEESFTVDIHPLRDLIIDGGIICVDPETNTPLTSVLLETGLNPSEYTVDWYLNGNIEHTGVSYDTNTPGLYTVEFTKLTPDTPPACNYNTTTVEVFRSSIATVDQNSVVVSEYFVDQNSITVNITGGYGQYTYQLDGGTPQTSNVFENVISGDHIITITDTYGDCGSINVNATVINYPKFFSPNGDGYNDFWNIWDLRSVSPDAEIIIFNRFGKFITNFNVNSGGWDGTYNGEKLFSDDYWFIVKYKNQDDVDKEFRAHFSLKR